MTKTYELVVLFSSDLTESDFQAAQASLQDLLKKHTAEVTSTEVWGKRVLAYPINKKTEAYYVLNVFTLEPEKLLAFDVDLRLMPNVIRLLCVIQDPKHLKTTASVTAQEEQNIA